MLKYVVQARAEADLQDVTDFYMEHAGNRLAEMFLAEFERVLNLLCKFPALGTPLTEGRRVFPLRRFPYSVFYFQHGEVLRVIAVIHQRRNPVIKPH